MSKHFDVKCVGDEFFGFTFKIWMHQGDVVIGADDIAQCREAFFNASNRGCFRKGVADMLEFLVSGGCRKEEAFAVSCRIISSRAQSESGLV